MSFTCSRCFVPKALGVKPIKRVMETRKKVYMEKGEAIGFGTEIVKEARLCPQCNRELDEEADNA